MIYFILYRYYIYGAWYAVGGAVFHTSLGQPSFFFEQKKDNLLYVHKPDAQSNGLASTDVQCSSDQQVWCTIK